MGDFSPFLFVGLLCVFGILVPGSHQLQSSQTQVLQQLKKHLEYPKAFDTWTYYNGDLCYAPSSPQISIVCEGNSISELKIMGDKASKVSVKYQGFPISNVTLSAGFMIDSFVTTLARLTSLKVLSLVSLGIWGPLPNKIHRLYSLELLDFSSNYLYGVIPPKISEIPKLRVLTLDGNFFNGTVPNWFDSLTNLTVLCAKSNRLKGPIPSSLTKVKTLTTLALSNNEINGKLFDLSSLTSLHVLDLRENKIESQLPIMPKGLITVLLSNNSFSGEIPKQFSEVSLLQHLDLSFNFLQGIPPAALFTLQNISYLNLASNMLSGSLPTRLNCSGVLGFVDISNNKLSGGLPSCLSSTSAKRVVKFGGNCLSIDLSHQYQASYCKKAQLKANTSGSDGMNVRIIIAVVGGSVILVGLLAFLLFICCRRCSRKTSERNILARTPQDNSMTGFSSEMLANARYISDAAKLGTQGVPTYRMFSIEELKEATNNFHHATFMGEGSIGKIYKGKLENGIFVAIRCLALFKRDSIRNLKLRLDMLSKLRHPNLVSLLGHCIDGGERDDVSVNRVFLIYEYVHCGNLYTYISDDSPDLILKWSERLTVVIGIGKAVHFLHTGIIPGFFNNQLKTNSILLDENRMAKLSDYGLSIITKEIDKYGAKGEVNKSWHMTKLEDDVYSFGFILLEMLVGPTKAGRGETYLLNEMTSFGSQDGRCKIVDPTVLSTSCQESLTIAMSITNKCISPEVSSRPSFEDVLWNLQYAAQVQATADGERISDAAAS